MSKQPKIGIIVSKREWQKDPGEPGYLHLRHLLREYSDVLNDYDLMAPNETAALINEYLGQERISGDLCLGKNTYGIIRLGAWVAEQKHEIERVFVFTDRALRMELPVNYALLRNCNLFGVKLHNNESAWQWAEYQRKNRRKEEQDHEKSKPGPYEHVAYIAHDREKDRITWFVNDHIPQLRRFEHHIATAHTGHRIMKRAMARADKRFYFKIETAGEQFESSHGPSGGDMIISDRIKTAADEHGYPNRLTPVFHVLFFVDHHSAHPHMADIRVLLGICSAPKMRVNLILNSRMAEEWIKRYEPAEPDPQ